MIDKYGSIYLKHVIDLFVFFFCIFAVRASTPSIKRSNLLPRSQARNSRDRLSNMNVSLSPKEWGGKRACVLEVS